MELDLNQLYQKAGATKKDLAMITGISRMSVSKTTVGNDKDTIYVPDAKYYEIHKKMPQYLPLPEDFFHYTRPILMLNKYLYHVDTQILYQKLSKYKVRGYRVYFLYSNKNEIDAIFPELILPYYLNGDGVAVPYEGEDFRFANMENGAALHEAYTYGQAVVKWPGKDRAYISRYSPLNIRANMIIYNMQLKDAAGLFGRDISRDIRFHHPVSFIQDREMLERLFSPYLFLRPEDLANAGIRE